MDTSTHITLGISMLLMLTASSEQQEGNFNSSFEVSPGQIVLGGLGPTNRMSLKCLHPGTQHDGVAIQAMEIGKTFGYRRLKMATLRHGGGPHIVDESIIKRSSSFGSITGYGGYMYLYLYQLRCDDQGMYYCEANSTHNTSIALYQNVTVTATAHIPYMRVTPSASRHPVGLDLHIRCSGRVGSQFNSSLWKWEWRSAGESRSWTEYPHKERIRHERPTQDPVSGCELQAASTLTHTITNQDDGRRIRCSVGDAKYSDEVTIRLDSPDGDPSLPGDKSTLLVYCVSVLLLLGTGLGLTATICLMWRRRRARRQDTETTASTTTAATTTQDVMVPRRPGYQEAGVQFISYPSVDAGMYGDSLKPPLPDSNI